MPNPTDIYVPNPTHERARSKTTIGKPITFQKRIFFEINEYKSFFFAKTVKNCHFFRADPLPILTIRAFDAKKTTENPRKFHFSPQNLRVWLVLPAPFLIETPFLLPQTIHLAHITPQNRPISKKSSLFLPFDRIIAVTTAPFLTRLSFRSSLKKLGDFRVPF